MGKFTFLAWLLLVVALPPTRACKKYTLDIKELESCHPESVIVIDKDFSIVLEEREGRCLVVPNGCVTFRKTVTTSTVEWNIKKGGFDMSGNKNFCDMLIKEKESIGPILKTLNVKETCPYPKGQVCFKEGKGVDITSYASFLGMAVGVVSGSVAYKHDSGQSCVRFKGEVKKLSTKRG